MAGALREVLARFGIAADTRQLDQAGRRVSSTTQSLRRLVAAAGGAATLYAFQRFISSTVVMGDDLDKSSQQVGLTTRELQAFRHAAELSGVDAAGFGNALGQLQLKAQKAAHDGGEQARVFTDLGIAITDSTGELLSGGELLRNVADAMQRTTNPTERTAVAMELMGRSGRHMIPMLTGGREGLTAMEAELDQLGGGASQEFIRQSVQMTDDLTRLRVATTSLRTTFVTAILPTLTRVVRWLTQTAAALSRSGAAAATVRPILIALGVAAIVAGVQAAIAWGAAVAPILLAALAVTALYLAFDDLAVAFSGEGHSMIVEFLDSLGYLFDEAAFGTMVFMGARMMVDQFTQSLENGTTIAGAFWNVISMLFGRFETGSNAIDQVTHAIERLAGVLSRLAGYGPILDRFGLSADTRGVPSVATIGAETMGGMLRSVQRLPSRNLTSGAEWRDMATGWLPPSVRRFATGTPGEPRELRRAPMRSLGRKLQIPNAVGLPGPGGRGVVIDSHARTEVHVHAAENPEATARVVRRELDRREQASARAVLAAVEPARAGGT